MELSRKCSPDSSVSDYDFRNINYILLWIFSHLNCLVHDFVTSFVTSFQVVEGEQVPWMCREREGLQRGQVQGTSLSICQGGELRHDVSNSCCLHNFCGIKDKLHPSHNCGQYFLALVQEV